MAVLSGAAAWIPTRDHFHGNERKADETRERRLERVMKATEKGLRLI